MTLIEALEVICACHIKALEFDDWRVEMPMSGSMAPWDYDRYVPAWTTIREAVLAHRKTGPHAIFFRDGIKYKLDGGMLYRAEESWWHGSDETTLLDKLKSEHPAFVEQISNAR